jgi:salicylate hydroxylase
MKEVGAGIQISPNATRILHRLGLADALRGVAVRPGAIDVRRWSDGRVLSRQPLGDAAEAAFGAPYYHVHRADLLSVLSGALPPERVHTGKLCLNVAASDGGAEASFEDGTCVTADLIIGADGVHSRVRRSIFNTEKARFSGNVAYRGLVPLERVASLDLERNVTVWIGPGKHFVHYFVSGGRLVNFVAVIEESSWTRESWSDRGDIADALAAYEGWHPQVRAILGAVGEVFRWALLDRPPLDPWSHGRVTLMGDACHPMLPFMAQGAAQAIEDAATLAICLKDVVHSRIPEALQRYEALRRPRTTKVQEISLANATTFHLPDGPKQQERDAQMSARSAGRANSIAWLYGHDAEAIETNSDALD